MKLVEFLKSVPVPVLIIVLVVLLVITLIMAYQYLKAKGLDGIRADVYHLILVAEHTFLGSEQGKQKLKWVVQQARGLLPKWLQLFVTEKALMDIIDKWFKGVKDLLDDGKINGSQEKQVNE